MRKKGNSLFKTTTILIVLLIIVLIVFLFGARIYLLINMLLGNDVLVKVNLDKRDIFLFHNQTEKLSIKTEIVTNPFCTVYCNYSFLDLSYGETIETGSFNLKTIRPFDKEFLVTSPKTGQGQKLYRFEIKCNSKKTYLCDTKEEASSRTILITMNYELSPEEIILKEDFKWKILEIMKELDYIKSNSINQKNTINLLNYEDKSYLENKTSYLELQITETNKSLEQSKNIWESQEYDKLSYYVNNLEDQVYLCNNTFNNLSSELEVKVNLNNYLVDSIFELDKNLTSLSYLNVTNKTAESIDELITEYNLLASSNNWSIDKRNKSVSNLTEKILTIQKIVSQESLLEENRSYSSSNKIITPKTVKLTLSITNARLDLTLNDPPYVCCVLEKCLPCCNDTCSNEKEKFPVLFIHGHNFNKDLSAEYNLYTFMEIQEELEKYGYLDAGAIFASYEEENMTGLWGKTNSPVTITSSYYFDILKDSTGESILESKQDNIDTYAIRLNDIIKSVKQRTGREKVIIVTHSMGGLVSRRYLELFGNSSVDKLIMVMTPNHGIDGSILSYCSIFGSELECKDMGKNSVFMNKLNNDARPAVPIYNIIGVGCNMDGENGDGIVTNSSAYLDFAENYYINGSCDELKFSYLHTEITSPDKHPEIVPLLKELIEK